MKSTFRLKLSIHQYSMFVLLICLSLLNGSFSLCFIFSPNRMLRYSAEKRRLVKINKSVGNKTAKLAASYRIAVIAKSSRHKPQLYNSSVSVGITCFVIMVCNVPFIVQFHSYLGFFPWLPVIRLLCLLIYFKQNSSKL